MTDKQIIIYKKECYNEPYCSLNQVLEQLKRKEQECERLRFPMQDTNYAILTKEEFEQLEAYKMEAEEGKEINAELKAENEELKIYIESNEQQVKEVETLVMDNDRLINELDQLKTALTEIKEIATNFYETGFLRTDNGCILINNNTCVETLDKILQEISECEGNDEINIFPLS